MRDNSFMLNQIAKNSTDGSIYYVYTKEKARGANFKGSKGFL